MSAIRFIDRNAALPGPPAEPAPAPAAETDRVTPMMAQYLGIKADHPDALLFYRMGDFYELFLEDAVVAAKVLGIVLTKRGKHNGDDIAMCGVPVERSDDYLHTLIAAGHTVAVCEQTEDPAEARKRGGKSVVRRAVVRIVTPGTITEERLLEPCRANLLAALSRVRLDEATLDLRRRGRRHFDRRLHRGRGAGGGTRRPCWRVSSRARSWSPMARGRPGAACRAGGRTGRRDARGARTRRSDRGRAAPQRVVRRRDARRVRQLHARRDRGRRDGRRLYRAHPGRRAPRLARPQPGPSAATRSRSTPSTRANLEMTRTLGGERAGSLLHAVDATVTPGRRTPPRRAAGRPADRPGAIAERLDAVGFAVADRRRRGEVRAVLKRAPDMARALSRLSLGRGGPRDLAALRDGLAAAYALSRGCSRNRIFRRSSLKPRAPPGRIDAALGLALGAALGHDLPLMARDGGFIRAGHDLALDEARELRDDTRKVVAALQARYAEVTEVRTLKIKHNNFLGFFIEVPARSARAGGSHPTTRSSSTARPWRGHALLDGRTGRTRDQDRDGGRPGARHRARPLRRARGLRSRRRPGDPRGRRRPGGDRRGLRAGRAGRYPQWVRPLVDASLPFRIEAGAIRSSRRRSRARASSFVANGCDLSGPRARRAKATGGRIAVVTGPNMAGKSTFLRQNALIAILAQAGSFVPAAEAHIGVVDRLFSRVGAADDLARGRSTFMVEMVETAAILNQATGRSLVILDEIGRGTATFDGLSIAWAAMEHLHDSNRSRGLFATHFHELTQLTKKLPRLANLTMRVTDWNGDVVFLHEVVAGAADRSYGIQVAKLAGLPPSAVERAKKILAELEKGSRSSPVERMLDDLPLFAGLDAVPPRLPPGITLREALDAVDPDELTPKQALEALYALKRAAKL